MKRSVCLLSIIIVASILSGCIISKTPSADDVSMSFGEQKTFSVKVFPSNATYTWTLDGTMLSNTGNSYEYTAQGGTHSLIVKAKHSLGTDTKTWNITCDLTSTAEDVIETQQAAWEYYSNLKEQGTDDPVGKTVDWLKTQLNVADVEIEGNGNNINIKFKCGVVSTIMTSTNSPLDSSTSMLKESDSLIGKTSSANLALESTGNKKAIFILPFDDDGLARTEDSYMQQYLESIGYTVDTKINTDVTIDLLKQIAWSDYEVIYMSTHGNISFGDVSVKTRQEVTKTSLISYLSEIGPIDLFSLQALKNGIMG